MKLNKTEIKILAGRIYDVLEKENMKLQKEFEKSAREDVKKYVKEIKNVIPDYIFNEISGTWFDDQIYNGIEEKFYKRKYDFYESNVADDIVLKLANNGYVGDVESLEQDLLTKYQNNAK